MKVVTGKKIAAIFLGLCLVGVWPADVPSQDKTLAQHLDDGGQTVAVRANAALPAPIIEPHRTVPIGGTCEIDLPGIDVDTFDYVIIGGEWRWDGKQGVAFTPKKLSSRVGQDFRTKIPYMTCPTNREMSGTYSIFISGGPALRVIPLTIGTGPEPPPVDPDDPIDPPPPPPPLTKVVAATFFYEKDQHQVPPGVLSGLNRLNREKKIVATLFDDNTTDGAGQVPDQYKVGHVAARQAGLPVLVVTGPAGVIKVVKNPKTEDEILKAVP